MTCQTVRSVPEGHAFAHATLPRSDTPTPNMVLVSPVKLIFYFYFFVWRGGHL